MNEPFDNPLWADHHQELTDALHQVALKIGEVFRTLSDIEFDAPWQKPSSTTPC